MAWYRVLAQSIINRRIVNPGEAVEYAGQPGKALRLMTDEEVEKYLASLDVPPTRTVEQRLDAIEQHLASLPTKKPGKAG